MDTELTLNECRKMRNYKIDHKSATAYKFLTDPGY